MGDSVVALVDETIHDAISKHASDIHLEPHENELTIRYRVDGVLYPYRTVEQSLKSQFLSRIKVLAHLNIAERRVPQDGKFSLTVSKRFIDLRVSTFPTIQGEKIAIRILDREHNKIDLDQVGFDLDVLSQFHTLINGASGFLLVTGPTGSGKTTTLYGVLAELTSPEKNIVTLEDPVEYTLDGVTQSQIHPESGFTFEKGIRALIRQDPDIIMVGEIRDKQTAHIAIEAALTGHLVLSTLHTANAPSAVVRLMDMGIEPFLINAALSGVLAQRLVRKICVGCRITVEPSEEEQLMLSRYGVSLGKLFKGAGCTLCFNLGYAGRTGIFELLTTSNALRALVVRQPIIDAIYQQALVDGMKTLATDGIQKVSQGIITLQELLRVL